MSDGSEPATTADTSSTANATRASGSLWDVSSLLATAAIFYALGMVVENLYLLNFGGADFSLLRPRAVVTGLLLALPTVVSLVLPTLYFERPKPVEPGGPWHLRVRRRISQAQDWSGVVFLQVLPVTYYSAAVLAQPGRTPPTWLVNWLTDIVLPGAGLWFSGLIASLSGVFLVLIATGNEDRVLDELGQVNRDRTPRTLRNTAWLLAGLVVIGAAHIILFVAWVYPSVPRQIGGARPQDVQLVVDGEDVQALTTIGMTWAQDPAASGSPSRLTGKLQLIEAGEDYYLVKLPTGIALQLPSSEVGAVRFESP